MVFASMLVSTILLSALDAIFHSSECRPIAYCTADARDLGQGPPRDRVEFILIYPIHIFRANLHAIQEHHCIFGIVQSVFTEAISNNFAVGPMDVERD